MKQTLTLALLGCLLSACASIHPGKMGTMIGGEPIGDVKVSAEKAGFSDENYTFFTVTVENKTSRILRIKNADLEWPEAVTGGKCSIIVGKDLLAWAEAYEAGAKRREHNKRVAQTALMLGGALVGVTGLATDSDELKIIGGAAALAGASWTLVSVIDSSLKDAKNPSKVPATHLLSPWAVPVGMFVRKWVVVQKPVGYEIKKFHVLLTLEDESENVYAISLE